MPLRTRVFGPAYLDRVILVDGPLGGAGASQPLDQSVEGVLEKGPGLAFVDPEGAVLGVVLPDGWAGPTGTIRVSGTLGGGQSGGRRSVGLVSAHDDLGGMGAGFAGALGGTLFSVLGPEDDPVSQEVARLLGAEGVEHRPTRVGHPADWTLLLTSGPHGDKLPVGFRGAHLAWEPAEVARLADEPCDLRVVAGLPNRAADAALRAPGAGVRLFAPAVRNMADREHPVSRFAEFIDVLCCNRREWSLLEDREQVAWAVPVLAVTDGPAGAVVRYTRPDGDSGRLTVPAFPRSRPPVDTNRAGEAFAATLIKTLLGVGWHSGVIEPELVGEAALRASAAAALVLDRPRFGFPTDAEVDAALAAGRLD